MSLTPAQRKSLQRKRDKAAGWKVVESKIDPAREDELKAFVASLPPPPLPVNEDQLDLIEYIDRQIRGEVEFDPKSDVVPSKPKAQAQGALF